MHIKDLINSIVDEAAKPKVKPDGKGGFVDAGTGQPVSGDNTVQFPKKAGTTAAPQPNLNISYQGKKVDPKTAGNVPLTPAKGVGASAAPQSNLNVTYQGKKVDPKTAGTSAAPQTTTQQPAGAASTQPQATPAPGAAPTAGGTAPQPAANQQPAQQEPQTIGQQSGAAQGKKSINWSDVGKKASNFATGTLGALGNIASQTAQGIGQTIGAARGGYLHGRETGKQGKLYRFAPDDGTSSTAGSAANQSQAGASNANVDGELADLKSMINRLDRRLGNLEQNTSSTTQSQAGTTPAG